MPLKLLSSFFGAKTHMVQAAGMAPKSSLKGVKKLVQKFLDSLMSGEVGLLCNKCFPIHT